MRAPDRPLAERMRPERLDEVVGQPRLVSLLKQITAQGTLPSIIFWGPPGVGKTTLARILAGEAGLPFYSLSAIASGVKEVREVIGLADKQGRVVLFIDEIHRFNKAQQDALLGAVEKGTITLIGATTENPSFEVINALLSRCQVYVLEPLTDEDLLQLISRAISEDEWLKARNPFIEEYEALLYFSGGDARKLLNLLELVVSNTPEGQQPSITNVGVQQVLQRRQAQYDKGGEMHYDVISAFIKSMRGSDPNAAVYWLARMLEGGEDPLFIARRMLILASEDIGHANPNALLLATSTFQAIERIGMPEGRIILSQCATYLAASPKSNSAYMAIEEAWGMVRKTGDLPVPLHLRNAPTKLMKNLGYGADYRYSHDFEDNFAAQEYLPEKISGKAFFEPGKNTREEEMRKWLHHRWKGKYGY